MKEWEEQASGSVEPRGPLMAGLRRRYYLSMTCRAAATLKSHKISPSVALPDQAVELRRRITLYVDSSIHSGALHLLDMVQPRFLCSVWQRLDDENRADIVLGQTFCL